MKKASKIVSYKLENIILRTGFEPVCSDYESDSLPTVDLTGG